MQEMLIKSHLIITNIHDEYNIKWSGKIAEAKPALTPDGLPTFVVISSRDRVELNTINMKQIEDCAKRLATPRGRSAVTSDVSRIYIKEVDGNEKFLGSVTKKHIKKFQQMYDKVGWR